MVGNKHIIGLGLSSLASLALAQPACAQRSAYQDMIAAHAKANDVPEALVHRVVMRESKYKPNLIGRGATLGLMQIKLATARGVGYRGDWEGLLDPETNIAYGVRYLAGAWRISHGSYDTAVKHYARGYYYDAKRMGLPPIQYASLPLATSKKATTDASANDAAASATSATYTTASVSAPATASAPPVAQPAARMDAAPAASGEAAARQAQELLRQAMIDRAQQQSQRPQDDPARIPAQESAPDTKAPEAKAANAKASAKDANAVPLPRPRPERAPGYQTAATPAPPNALEKMWDDLKRSLSR